MKIVVPARLASTRFPGKPLIDVGGVPMVIRVAQNCSTVHGTRGVVIATPDVQIKDVADQYGFECFLTKDDCRTGTDRVYEYSRTHKHDFYVNVQGDEPLMKGQMIQDFVNFVVGNSKGAVVGVLPIETLTELNDFNVVKVVISDNRLIYASRGKVPFKEYFDPESFFRHAGIYSFSGSILEKFGRTKARNLEQLENIEILRLIEDGVEVSVFDLPNFGPSIDTKEDLNEVLRILNGEI